MKYNSSVQNYSVQKSMISSKTQLKHKQRKPMVRMAFGLSNLSTHRRRSKVHSTKKRDVKAAVKKQEVPQDPSKIRSSIEENFKKMKQKQSKTEDKKYFLSSQYPAKRFLPYTSEDGLSKKRKMMLLNKENMQTC
mmetsp:Transcript_21558/g.19126  ORF Transcript_21558/g.19126 Transcript_21558/m.19126 type:complete len:135 (+) Transcript_21558:332-736(+)